MRAHVIGAGIAGLSFAGRLKARDSRHDVVVWERDARRTHSGLGVVLAPSALAWLKRTDPELSATLAPDVVRWSGIEIRKDDARERVDGYPYTAIARDRLVETLCARCAALGVDIRWSEPMTPDRLAALTDDPAVDLIVASDGIHSPTRTAHADAFAPREIHGSRYAWLGTDRRFDCLTFMFRRTAYGVFHAHAYPFDRRSSAFIVQCGDDTWRRADLANRAPAEQLALVGEIFAADVQGEPLSGDARWRRAAVVRNRALSCGKLVLLGDAAHAVHFSIGSGIRLAMAGALTLDASLARHARVADALLDYGSAAAAFVEPLQRISAASAHFFDRADRHIDDDIAALTTRLLTRTAGDEPRDPPCC